MKTLVNSILVMTFVMVSTMAYALPVTLDLNHTIDDGVASSSASWGTVTLEENSAGVRFKVDLVRGDWKILALGFNYDDVKFDNTSVFTTEYFNITVNENSSYNPGGLGTFDLELKSNNNQLYGTVTDTLEWDGGILSLADIYPWGDPEQGLLVAAHIGAIYGSFNGQDYGTDGSQSVGAKAPVPEPSTLLLLGAGISGLALYRRKKK